MQAGKFSSVHPSKFTDSIGNGLLDDNSNDLFFGAQEASTSAPAATNHGLPPRGGVSSEVNVTAAKMKAKTAQKRAETESLLTARPNGYESSVEDEDIGRADPVRYFIFKMFLFLCWSTHQLKGFTKFRCVGGILQVKALYDEKISHLAAVLHCRAW